MTFAELKTALDTFTPEQLAADVVWSGDERGGVVKRLWIAAEDWIENDDGDECVPRSHIVGLDDGDDGNGGFSLDGKVAIKAGTPRLVVDE